MIILVTGGSGSGKSEFAERLSVYLNSYEPLIYIATMFPLDNECQQKIQRHKIMRATKNFETLECYTSINKIQLKKNRTVLLECMSNLVANEMYSDNGVKENIVDYILDGINHLKSNAKNLIIVSNEIFSDNINYDNETLKYIKNLGQINFKIAKLADCVIEVVCGIPVFNKGEKICLKD